MSFARPSLATCGWLTRTTAPRPGRADCVERVWRYRGDRARVVNDRGKHPNARAAPRPAVADVGISARVGLPGVGRSPTTTLATTTTAPASVVLPTPLPSNTTPPKIEVDVKDGDPPGKKDWWDEQWFTAAIG